MICKDSFEVVSAELVLLPGVSLSEIEREVRLLNEKNKRIRTFIENVVSGTITRGEADEIYDMLAEAEIEPYKFLDAALENTKHLLEQSYA